MHEHLAPPIPHFKKLTEQEKRERGDNAVSLYEPFAVLREIFAPRSRGGKLLGVRRDERPPEGLLGSVLLLQKKRI